MIHLEQPPKNTPPELSAYLMRMFVSINNELNKTLIVPSYSVLPSRAQEGMIVNFLVEIQPEIPSAGIYIYHNNNWEPL